MTTEAWGTYSEKTSQCDSWDCNLDASTAALVPTHTPRVRVLGNLPFNISTALTVQWLHDMAERRGLWRYGRVPLTLTFQKEVGQRLAADVWHEQRSRLSVMAQAYCEVSCSLTCSSAFLNTSIRI